MIRKLALALSVVFQPLMVPSVIISVLFYVVPEATAVPSGAKWSILLLISLTTFFIPLLGIIGMRMTTTIRCFQMPDKKERLMPFSLISVFYIMTSVFFYIKLNVDSLLVGTMFMVTSCLILLTLVTAFWKISAHVTGLSGLLAVIVVLHLKFHSSDLLYPLILALLICGAVGSARLYLNAHKPSEVYGGFVLGFAFCFLVYSYLI
ncbi:PA-phosphatase [Negadavirga shengliensis]|uniref:PA-phosphatase n=1 Tax=Negadavirga shengliensis TaxID=1389218 RepID=A0ABV9SYU0_9BACT